MIILSEDDLNGMGQTFNLAAPMTVVGFNLGDAVIGFEVTMPTTFRPADPCCPEMVRLPGISGLAVVTEGDRRLVLTEDRPHAILSTPENFSVRAVLLEGTLTGVVWRREAALTTTGNLR